MKSVERFYLVANSFFSTAEQVNKLNGKTYSSHPETSADAQGLLGRGIERGWCIYSEHGYQRLQKGNPLQLRGRHVAVLLLDESEERKMKLKTTNYVLVASGESANTENMAEFCAIVGSQAFLRCLRPLKICWETSKKTLGISFLRSISVSCIT